MGWLGQPPHELKGGVLLQFSGLLASMIMLKSERHVSDIGLRHFERVVLVRFDARRMQAPCS